MENKRVMMCIRWLLGHQSRILQSKDVRGFPSSFPVVPWKKHVNANWVPLLSGVQGEQTSAMATCKGKSMELRQKREIP